MKTLQRFFTSLIAILTILPLYATVSGNGYYTRQISSDGTTAKLYCTKLSNGNLQLTGIAFTNKPANGVTITIPEKIDEMIIEVIGNDITTGTVNKSVQTHMIDWVNRPDSYKLSLPGTASKILTFAFSEQETDINGVDNNTSLTEITIRTAATSQLTIEAFAFYKSKNLSTITFEDNSVKTIGYFGFGSCPITKISALPKGIETIEGYAFNNICVEQDLILPSSLKYTGNNVFSSPGGDQEYGWFFHNEIVIPESTVCIGSYLFCGCRRMHESVVIPEGVKEIQAAAFANTLIKHLYIPSTVETILATAFGNMPILKTVTFKANNNLKTIGKGIFKLDKNLRYVDMSKVASPHLNWADNTVTRTDDIFAGAYPYTIIYLPQSITSPNVVKSGEENFIQNVGSAWVCNKFSVYDYHKNYDPAYFELKSPWQNPAYSIEKRMTEAEKMAWIDYKNALPTLRGCDYELPLAFTATEAVLYRQISPSTDNLLTLSLPYNATKQDGLRIYRLVCEINLKGSLNNKGAWFVSLDDERVIRNLLTQQELEGNMTANHPYVLKITNMSQLSSITINGATYYELFKTQNTPVPQKTAYTVVMATSTPSPWCFVGHPMNIKNSEATSNQLYVLSGKTWHPVKETIGGYVHSFRGALKFIGSKTSTKNFPQFIEDTDGSTTSIQGTTLEPNQKQIYYTIDGCLAGRDFDELPSGCYIIEGKKIIKQ